MILWFAIAAATPWTAEVTEPVVRWLDAPQRFRSNVRSLSRDLSILSADGRWYARAAFGEDATLLLDGGTLLGTGDLHGDGDVDVFFERDGLLVVTDLAGQVLQTSPWEMPWADEVWIGDLDADGDLEFVGLREGTLEDDLYISSATGAVERTEVVPRGSLDAAAIALAQLDGDPALEIVLPNQRLLDGATLLPDGAIAALEALGYDVADIDGDGIDELLITGELAMVVYDHDDGRVRFAEYTVATRGPYFGTGSLDRGSSFLRRNGAYTLMLERGNGAVAVVDAATGDPVDWLTELELCVRPVVADIDADGVDEVQCAFDRVIDPVDGAIDLPRFATDAGHPSAVDLDGDGVDEVLFLGDAAVVVEAATATVLDAQAVPLLGRPHDLDGDGVDGFFSSDGGIFSWAWDRATGFTSTALNTSGRIFDELRDYDADGDGIIDFVYRTPVGGTGARALGRIDFASGADVPLPVSAVAGRWEVVDLDGDGADEIVLTSEAQPNVFRGDGTTLASIPGRVVGTVTTASGTALLGLQGARLTLYELGATGTSERSLVLPEVPETAHVAGGRVWLSTAAGLVAWSPADGTTWRFATNVAPTAAPVVSGGHVYVVSGALVEVWPLP